MTSTATILDGKAIADTIRAEVRSDAASLWADHAVRPCLATVIVGDRPDSATYIRMKIRACEECGLVSVHEAHSADISEEALIGTVRKLNHDPSVHGILIQLPLPAHMDERRVLAHVSVDKDVDGFHVLNMGNLAIRGCVPSFVPCTPRGCIELLLRSNVSIEGKHAVVLGRSNIVGLPLMLLLLQHNATVTVAHSRTTNLADVVRKADLVFAAVGKTELVKRDWIKPGAVVVDVGMNSKPDASRKRGYRLVGDVDFEACKEVAGMITPVPGGVGPMTIAMVIRNCTDAAMRAVKSSATAAPDTKDADV